MKQTILHQALFFVFFSIFPLKKTYIVKFISYLQFFKHTDNSHEKKKFVFLNF